MSTNRLTMAAGLMGAVATLGMIGCHGAATDEGGGVDAATIAVHTKLASTTACSTTCAAPPTACSTGRELTGYNAGSFQGKSTVQQIWKSSAIIWTLPSGPC
jgi:hypothetical protein